MKLTCEDVRSHLAELGFLNDAPEAGVTDCESLLDAQILDSLRMMGRTAEVIDRDGWLDTGDMGSINAAGYLCLAGRADDLINVGGKKVYPSRIESVLASHPDGADCMCVAAADPEGILGEVPVAYVVACGHPPPDPGVLRRFAAGHLESHAVPRSVHYIDELPRSFSGKPLRRKLRAREAPGNV